LPKTTYYMRKNMLLVAALLILVGVKSQNVGIGTPTPHASALLDLSSNTKGLLVPRLTKSEKNAINNAATGLMVYQTGSDSSGFHYYNGSQWVWINPVSMASGAGLPASAIVMSETANNNALLTAGFSYNGLLRIPGATLEQTGVAAANTWLGTNTVTAPPPASGHLALFNDSVFYVWGGNAGSFNPGTGLFKYSPLTDRWTNMNIAGTAPAMGSTGVKLGNKWVHWGGYNYPALSGPPAVVYDLAANTIINSSNAPFSVGLAGVAGAGAGNKAYFFGGYYLTNFSIITNQGFIYNVQNNTWQAMSLTNAPLERYYAGMIHTDSHIMVWGGTRNTGLTNTGGLYDTTTNTWTPVSTTNAPSATIDPIMVWRSPFVYVIAGNVVKRYDPVANTWTDLAATPVTFSGNKFTYDGSRKIYIWGGARVFFAPAPTANGYVYDIVDNTFTTLPLAGAPDARGDHTLTFGNNMLLVWGGTTNNSSNTPSAAQSLQTGGRLLLAPATVTNAAPASIWHLYKKQ
jgi:hypothetical protein